MGRSRREPTSLAGVVRRKLAALKGARHESAPVFRDFESAKNVSPWLELTHWPVHLKEYRLDALAKLVAPLSMASGPVLPALCDGLERLVKGACGSVSTTALACSTKRGSKASYSALVPRGH